MKKLKKIFFLFYFFCILSYAQSLRLAYIHSEYIFSQIPEYAQAKDKLENLAGQWEQDLALMWEEIQILKEAYQNDKIFLTQTMKDERLSLIQEKEKNAQLFKQQKFGVEGELIQRQREFLAPIENLFLDTIQKIIEQEKYSFIFDIAKQSGIFTNYSRTDKLNLSDYVLKKMGYIPKK